MTMSRITSYGNNTSYGSFVGNRFEVNTLKKKLEKWLVKRLLQSDGSTTRLIESIVSSHSGVCVDVHHQELVPKNKLDPDIGDSFGAECELLRRISSLRTDESVISDNVVLGRFDLFSRNLQESLLEGRIPLGVLMAKYEYKRELIWSGYQHTDFLKVLFQPYKLPPGYFPFKQYLMIRDNQTWFYVFELFHDKIMLDLFWSSIQTAPQWHGSGNCQGS